MDDRSGPSAAPDVAVVIIGYNDAKRLPNAVKSALNQTLDNLEIIIVDDASTDGMGDVADEWAARSPKVRSIHLPENSGGCSRPRNVGLEHVRARYVMFLDSDDVLERHACKNLLLAAERSGADFAAGRCVRVSMDRNRQHSPWCATLYDEPRVVAGIYEMPDLLGDTLCTNKLYSVAFLDKHAIRFPEGLLYEDLPFSTEAYCSAARMAIIPEVVYYWRVYKRGHRVSITQARAADMRNFRDRLAVYRVIDAFLDREGHAEIKSLIDSRFFRIALRMWLWDLAERDPEYQREWMQLAGEYLRELDLNRIMSQEGVRRLAAYLVRQGDLELTLKAAAMWRYGRPTTPLVLDGGRLYFTDRYLGDDAGREAMDVTWLWLREAQFPDIPLYCELTGFAHRRRGCQLTGVVVNQLRRLPAAHELSLSLELRSTSAGKPVVIEVPVSRFELSSEHLTFTAAVAAGSLPRGPGQGRDWGVRLAIRRGPDAVSVPVYGSGGSGLVDNQPAGRRGLPLTPVLKDGLRLGLRDNRSRGRQPLRVRVQRRLSAWPPWQRVQAVIFGRRLKAIAYRHVFRRLPLRADVVVFESHLGKQYSDSPRYIYEEMVSRGLPIRAVWSYVADPGAFPADATRVRRDSWRYYYEIARAGHVIDNQGLPSPVLPRSRQRYVQTWHGTPFKLMGSDQPALARNPKRVDDLRSSTARWDHFVVQSQRAEQIFRSAFGLNCSMLRTGYPRNDRLHRCREPEQVAKLRHELRLPADRKILLYAPTFRRYPRPITIANPGTTPQFDLHAFNAALGGEWFVLLRAHYLDSAKVMDVYRHTPVARNMSEYHDVTDLMLVADALLTDYSSLMFDYAITGRPMAFYAPDYELYRQLRGSYFALHDEVPGPILKDTTEIVDWLGALDDVHQRYQDRYRDFRSRWCEFETGSAAAQIVTALFGPETASG